MRRAPPRLDGAEVHVARYSDTDAARSALQGVETLLMVSASETADRVEHHRTFVEAAAAAGVRSIVYTSFLAPHPTRCSPSGATTRRPRTSSARRG